MMRKLRIGITGNILIMDGGMLPGIYRSYVNNDYVESLEQAGCIPVLLPVISNLNDVKEQMEGLDGIVLSGGYDIDPALYGEHPMQGQGFTMNEVDRFYLAVIHAADEKKIPVLGICKGIQAINVAYKGTLYQDLKTQKASAGQHMQQAPRYSAFHQVETEEGSFLRGVLGEKEMVNSFHHQSIKDTAPGFRVTARALDGVVEGIEKEEGTFMAGVQWHPEMMAKFGHEKMTRLFEKFAEKCRK